jgi:hypothetical protein
MSKEDEATLKNRQTDMLNNMSSAIRNGDMNKVTDYIQKYVEMSGDPKSINNARFKQMVITWNTDFQQRSGLGAEGYSGVQKYMRVRDMLNKVTQQYGPTTRTQ